MRSLESYKLSHIPGNNLNVKILIPLLAFFCGEGPRSRCYGRTAALRLLVQPCDEDEEKDDQFCFSFFQVMEHRWNETDRGKPKYSGKNLPLCLQQIPNELTRDRTRASVVGLSLHYLCTVDTHTHTHRVLLQFAFCCM
jgi:hypothetical protein